MLTFNEMYNKIIMQELDGVYPEESENTSNISIQEKIADVITDELEDLPESEWKDKLPQIEELVIEGLSGSEEPEEQINKMDYLDFVNLVINALKDLGIVQE